MYLAFAVWANVPHDNRTHLNGQAIHVADALREAWPVASNLIAVDTQ